MAQPDNDRVYACDPAANVDGFCLRDAEDEARDCWPMRLFIRRADETINEKSARDFEAQQRIERANTSRT